jgi:hypothetical protein
MEMYIGVKVIKAEKCWGRYNKCINPNSEFNGSEKEGYKVVYEDGYISWSPKDVFEKAYKKYIEKIPVITKELLPHQERVREEAVILKEKIEKLNYFIGGNSLFMNLPKEEQDRLQKQLEAMCYYLAVLIERINNF